jgi:large subunit ribosomal protein L25
MVEILHVQKRDSRGKHRARQLRRSGYIPAILYGHGAETVSLSIPASELSAALRHGAKLVELADGVQQNALIREVQWDALGVDLLHVDLARVEMGERVKTTVSIELRGQAAGTRQGGIIVQITHDVEIECPVSEIPEHLTLNINALELDQSLTAAALPLPAGAVLLTDPETTIVQCSAPAVEKEEVEVVAPAEPVEPEVIGRKAAEKETEPE